MKLEYITLESGDAKRNSSKKPESINTNIAMVNVAADGDNLMVNFEFTATYAPDESYIRLIGIARFSGKEARNAAQEWAKTKRITGKEGELIVNSINYAASINGVLMAKVFNMTPPLILPTLTLAGK